MSYILFLIVSAGLLLTVEGKINLLKISLKVTKNNNKTICESTGNILKEGEHFKMILEDATIVNGSCRAGNNIYDLQHRTPTQINSTLETQELSANLSMNVTWECLFKPKPAQPAPSMLSDGNCSIIVIVKTNIESSGNNIMWYAIGGVFAILVVIVIIAQTVLMLHFRAKARSQSQIKNLLSNNTDNKTSDKARYSMSPCKKLQVAVVTTDPTTDYDGDIYESLEDVRGAAAMIHGNQAEADNPLQPPKTPIDISKRPPEPLPAEAVKVEGIKFFKPSKQKRFSLLRKSFSQTKEVQKEQSAPTKEPVVSELNNILRKRREVTTPVAPLDPRPPMMDSLQRSKSPRRNVPPAQLIPTNETPTPPKPLANKPVLPGSLQRNKNPHFNKPALNPPKNILPKPMPSSVPSAVPSSAQNIPKRLPPPPIAEKPMINNTSIRRNPKPGLNRLPVFPPETSRKNIHTGFPSPMLESKRHPPPAPEVTQSQAYNAGFPSQMLGSKRPPPPVPEVTQSQAYNTENLYDNEENGSSDEDWCYEQLPEYNLYNI